MNITIERPHVTFYIGNSNVCPICHRLRDNYVWTSQCTQFESFTFKMRSRTLTIWMKIGKRTFRQSLWTCIRLEKLTLLGPAICLQYIIVLFVLYGRTYVCICVRTCTQTAKIAPFQLRWNGVKSKSYRYSRWLIWVNRSKQFAVDNNCSNTGNFLQDCWHYSADLRKIITFYICIIATMTMATESDIWGYQQHANVVIITLVSVRQR